MGMNRMHEREKECNFYSYQQLDYCCCALPHLLDADVQLCAYDLITSDLTSNGRTLAAGGRVKASYIIS